MARTDDVWNIQNNSYIQTTAPAGYDVLINGSNKYLNFNAVVGSSGYGIRDNAGVMEFKDSGGAWASFGTGGGGYTNLTEFVAQTPWRVFYSDGSGDVTELALGADGTFLKSNGASSAPTFATPAGSGDVSKVGTPVANQVGYWTGDGTLAGDAGLTYDPTTDALTAVTFVGALTGNVTGNVSGTAATVTGAAQTAITSLGTLTALDVDNININGNTISSTAGTDLLITPLAGQQIILDGTIEIDAGVVTGATSITSTTFVGALTGNASTATNVAVGGITGLGTNVATALAVNVGSAGAFITFNGDAGTPSALVGTNISGTAASLTAGVATLANTVASANEATDTTCFPLFITASGTLIGYGWDVTGSGSFVVRGLSSRGSAPASGSLIKTKKGLAIASDKTMKGLAIASVKTDKGLTNV